MEYRFWPFAVQSLELQLGRTFTSDGHLIDTDVERRKLLVCEGRDLLQSLERPS